MNFCQSHWDKLRAAIKDKGLETLISDSGEKAARVMAEAANGREMTLDTFDPLLGAWGAINSNCFNEIQLIGGNPLILMVPEGQGQGEPYPRCPICYLNWIMDKHEEVCKDPQCQKPKGEAAHFEWMIDRAANDQVDAWKALGNG